MARYFIERECRDEIARYFIESEYRDEMARLSWSTGRR
jgi:hypothetical protein